MDGRRQYRVCVISSQGRETGWRILWQGVGEVQNKYRIYNIILLLRCCCHFQVSSTDWLDRRWTESDWDSHELWVRQTVRIRWQDMKQYVCWFLNAIILEKKWILDEARALLSPPSFPVSSIIEGNFSHTPTCCFCTKIFKEQREESGRYSFIL